MSEQLAEPRGDCPLPVRVQRRNMCYVAMFWSIYYLTAPISYIGLTHANLLKGLKNSDTICNLPSAMYLWLAFVPVLVAWAFPRPRHLKPMGLVAVGLLATATAGVAISLWLEASRGISTTLVIIHGAVFGGANGVLLMATWDALKRGVSSSRRGPVLALTFGVGPLFACVGALGQDALLEGKLLGGSTFGLEFPLNYMAMFVVAAPLLLLLGIVFSLYTLPTTDAEPMDSDPPLAAIAKGVRQFLQCRAVWIAVVIYVVVYSGGNAIFANLSLHAKDVLRTEEQTRNEATAYVTIMLQDQPLTAAACTSHALVVPATESVGMQNFLRFGCKALAGALLGWLLTFTNPRTPLLVTTSILLFGILWAINSTGWWFLATFGILGAGELFGVYFPNYVTSASDKKFVRVNMAYMSVIGALVGFSSVAFGAISDTHGRVASFYVAAGLLVFGLLLIGMLLPVDPATRSTSVNDS